MVQAPRALSRRVIRSAIRDLKGDLLGIEFEALERIRELCEGAEGSGRLQVPGVDVMRSFDWIRFVKMVAAEGARNWSMEIQSAGRLKSPDGELILEQQDRRESEAGAEPAYNVGTCWLDLDRLGFPLVFRNWRPGDSYVRVGRERAESVKELFQSHRIPLWERRNWPMVAKGDEIVWSYRFGPAAAAVAPERASRAWRLRFEYQGRERAGS